MKIFYNILFASFFLFCLDSFASQTSVFVVAKVDNHLITNLDLADRYKIILKMSNIVPNNATEKSIILNQILQKMIDEELQIIEAQKLGINLDQNKFEEVKKDLANDLKQSPENLRNYFQSKGMSYDGFMKQIEAQILWSEIIRNSIAPKIKVGNSEINELIELRKVKTVIDKYLVSEIFIHKHENNHNIDSKSLAKKLFEELKSGKGFEKIAEQFSRSPTAEFGGEIGWVGNGDIDKKFYEAISKTKIGEVTEPIESKDGYYIFKVSKKESFNTLSEQDKDQLTNIIFSKKMQLSAKGYLMELRNNTYIEINEKGLDLI